MTNRRVHWRENKAMTPLHRGELNDNTPVSDAGLAGIGLVR